MADKISYINKDYKSILRNLVETSPIVTQAYDPQSENDPMTFILKNIALMGDMLAFYLDKQALETAPATMTQRKVADSYYRMMGYYMKWYRPAYTTITIKNKKDGPQVTLPRWTTFTSTNRSINVVLIDKAVISSNTASETTDVTAYEGRVISKTGISVVDLRYELDLASSKTMYIDSFEVIDSSKSEWTRVEDISKYPLIGKYYDVYVDENDRAYVRFSRYLQDNPSLSIESIKYLSSYGEGTTIAEGISTQQFSGLVGGIINPSDDTDVSKLSIVRNSKSPYSTKGPETPQEAYKNAQLYINTSDTLITARDYENAIKRSQKISNTVVTDNFTEVRYRLQNDGNIDVNDDIVVGSSNDTTKSIPSNLYIARPIFGNFESTTDASQLVRNQVKENKCINLTDMTVNDVFLLTWMPVGTITLSEAVTQDEADSILSNICYRLASDYHPSNIEFGERVKITDLVSRIKSYDNRILLVDIKPLEYKITSMNSTKYVNGNCDKVLFNLYRDFILGQGISPKNIVVNGETIESNRHWTKYKAYDSNGSGDAAIGLNIDINSFTDYSSYINSFNGLADKGPLPSNSIEIDPMDFFDENHPYRSISIARFGSYKYYDSSSDSESIAALNQFKLNMKINKESIK